MKNIIIGLCVRNNELSLPAVCNNIEKLCNIFSNIIVLFAYDVSTDMTLKVLEDFKDKHNKDNKINVEILINKNLKTLSNIRTERIANARNRILDRIKEINTYNQYEIFAMMDANEYSCIGPINIETLEYYLQPEQYIQWDSLSFHRDAGDYDTWALSYDPFIFSVFHYKNWKNLLEKIRNSFKNIMDNAIHKDILINVFSSFNGFALYKYEYFKNCSYSHIPNLEYFDSNILSKQNEITECKPFLEIPIGDCEHRHFHLEAIYKNNAKIRVAPRSLFKKMENPPKNLRGPA